MERLTVVGKNSDRTWNLLRDGGSFSDEMKEMPASEVIKSEDEVIYVFHFIYGDKEIAFILPYGVQWVCVC